MDYFTYQWCYNGQCDDGDTDDDNDGALDDVDSDDNNENVCNDDDGDTCDECATGNEVDTDSDGVDVMLAELPDSTSVSTITNGSKNSVQVLNETQYNCNSGDHEEKSLV